MSPIAGWYDDPRDEKSLRYWDGEAWTDAVTPKQQAPAAPQWRYPGSPPAQQQTWNYGAPPIPPAPQVWPPAPGMAPPSGLSTPDGVAITSWGKRLGARLLDGIFVGIGGLPLTGYFLYHLFQALSDQLDDPHRSAFNPTSDVIKWEFSAVAMSIVIGVCYETFCLRHWAATPGKRILEIKIRSYDKAGPLSWSVVARRVGFMYGLSALGLVPIVSLFAALLSLVNYLFPLWDKRRQALHDKAAGTVVVENPKQPAHQLPA